MANIEFVIQMQSFHRRMHWMLSGLLQQRNPPSFSVRIDVVDDDPYTEYLPRLKE
ncbi:unnamed protein product, partial [marine sediment metagenome]